MGKDMAIRVRLSRILGEKRIRAAELCRRTGISTYALNKLCHEKNKGIEFATREKLCRVLGCPIGEIVEYVPEETRGCQEPSGSRLQAPMDAVQLTWPTQHRCNKGPLKLVQESGAR